MFEGQVHLLTSGSGDENREKVSQTLFSLTELRVAFTYERTGTRFRVYKSRMARC